MDAAYVEVTGAGSVAAAPDQVVLTLGVEHRANDVASALAGCRDRLAAMLDSARELGCRPGDLRSTGLRVNPDWRDGGPSGYVAGQDLTVRLTDTALAGAVIDAAAAAAGDAFRMNGLTWSVADPIPLRLRARELAWADARAQAEQYATLSGTHLGRVLRVQQHSGGGFGGAEPAMLKASADIAVEGGEERIETAVTVRWELS